jgi:hypothetical protein
MMGRREQEDKLSGSFKESLRFSRRSIFCGVSTEDAEHEI